MMGREWILVLSLGIFVGIQAFNNWAQSISAGLKQWSDKYGYAIAETKVNLTGAAIELAENPNFIADITNNQTNSLRGSLERHLSTSQLQELRVLGNDCNQINQAMLVSFGVETCRPGNQRAFHWVASPQGSILVYTHPINDKFKLTTAVRVDRHWGMNFLGSNFEKKGFDIKEKTFLGITLNRPQENEPHFFWSHWSSLLSRPFMDINGSKIPALPFSCLLVASALFLVGGYRRRVLELRLAKIQLQENISNCLSAWQIDPKNPHWPQEVVERSQAKVMQQQDEISQLKDSIQTLRATKEDLEKEVIDLQQSETMIEQIQRTIPSLIERITSWEIHLSKIEGEVNKNLIHDTDSLASITRDWKQDIEIRGVRKFLRSRLETEVAGEAGNQLVSELNLITNTTKTINQSGIFLKENIQEVIKHQKIIKKIAQFWQSSLTGISPTGSNWKFSQVIDDAILQVKMTMKHCQTELDKSGWIEPLVTMDVPYSVITAVIHQIFSAFAKMNHQGHVKLQYRSGAMHDQLVFTLIQGNSVSSDSHKAHITRHINAANSLAKNHGLLVRQLPATSQHLVLALAWRCNTAANLQVAASLPAKIHELG